MNNRQFGIVLIIVGIALVIWGYNIYDSAGSQVSMAQNGDAPLEAWAAMIGGAVYAAFGYFKLK